MSLNTATPDTPPAAPDTGPAGRQAHRADGPPADAPVARRRLGLAALALLAGGLAGCVVVPWGHGHGHHGRRGHGHDDRRDSRRDERRDDRRGR